MWDYYLKGLVAETVVVSINLVIFYILLLQSIALSTKQGVQLLTFYILWRQDCPDQEQIFYCEVLEDNLRSITGTKVIFENIVNLTIQVLLHLITLELLDKGTDIILLIVILLTSGPMTQRNLPRRHVG